MMRARVIGVALVLAMGGCAKKKDAGEGENKAPASAEPAKEAQAPTGTTDAGPPEMERVVIAPSEPPKIELLEAGAEPRTQLRFDPDVGAKRDMTMTMRMKIGMQLGARQTPPVATPPIQATGKVEIVEKTEGRVVGRMQFGAMEVLDEPGADPKMVSAMRAQLGSFDGMSSYTTIDASGAVIDGYLEIPKGIPDNIRQTMRQMGENAGQMTVPMPDEAVGVGAKWTATTTISNMGMNLIQTATYTLEKLEGTTAHLAVSLDQKVAPGPFAPPGLPPGTKVDIKKMSSTGKGEMHIDSKAPMPDRVGMDMETHMSMGIDAGGQTQDMSMDMELSMQIESSAGGAN